MPKTEPLSSDTADGLLKAMLVFANTVDHVLETRAVEAAGGPMSKSRVQVLSLLVHRRVQTATEIALFLGVTKPAVTQIIDSMVRDGLVLRRPSVVDRREVRLELTAKGRRTIRDVRAEQWHLIRSTMREKSTGQVATWLKVLTDLTRALAGADRTFERYCLQCVAHADGACVLLGGAGPCQFLQHSHKEEPPPQKRRKRR